MHWIRNVYERGLHWSGHPHALRVLCVLALSESVFFPIPPDVLLIPMCLAAQKKALLYSWCCSIFSVVGGVLGYFLGFAIWEYMQAFFYQFIPGFTPQGFQQMGRFYQEYNFWIVFTAGFTPIPYKIITVTAGIFHINFVLFLIASVTGRSARFFLVGSMIYFFGERIHSFINRYFNWLTLIIAAALVTMYLMFQAF